MISGCCENVISRKAAEDASTNFKLFKVWPSLPRPASGGLLIKLNLALNCSAALPGFTRKRRRGGGDEATATANNLLGLFPLHTRHTLLPQWLLHMKVSLYDGYPSKSQAGADSYQVQSERRLRKQRPRNLRRRALIRQFKMGPQNRKMYVTTSVPHASPRLA
jgi:hypothetical protein